MTAIGLSLDCWEDRCGECEFPDNCTHGCHFPEDNEEDDYWKEEGKWHEEG